MTPIVQPTDKDKLLNQLLGELAKRGIACRWAGSLTPYSDIIAECSAINADIQLQREFGNYLRANPIIQETVHTLLSHLMMASHGHWQDVPMPGRLIARNGAMISRWLPTFLIIDGPLGRFLRNADSPLHALLRTQHATYPLLAQARDLFAHNLFRRVRNGVGHWSFTFELKNSVEYLICFDWESGQRTVEISILEAEALHLASFSTIECLDRELFRHATRNT